MAKHMFITAPECPERSEHFAGELVRLFFQEPEAGASAGEAVGKVHNFHHKAGCGLWITLLLKSLVRAQLL